MFNMNIIFRKQSQFELFPGASGNNPPAGKPVGVTKDLTLSLENIIVLFIVFVMALVFFFSFGVERGKKLAVRSKALPKAAVAANAGPAETELAPEKTSQSKHQEQVVYPVDVPRELTNEGETPVQAPVEKIEEQELLFTIQVASFKQEADALKEADVLKGKGYDVAFVRQSGSYSIVCVGKFAQKAEAARYSNKLKKKYNDCLVRRL